MHHSDRGVQYVSTRYTERLAQAGIEPSVGSRGDSYDNASAESIIGLYKTEVVRRRGPWRGLEDVEFATLEWVHWYNNATTLGADRKCLPGRVRDELLSVAGRLARDGETQIKQSPENPGQFTLGKLAHGALTRSRQFERRRRLIDEWAVVPSIYSSARTKLD